MNDRTRLKYDLDSMGEQTAIVEMFIVGKLKSRAMKIAFKSFDNFLFCGDQQIFHDDYDSN